tara:strand:- start:2136 stop:4427 length:2292 start_codon:yes stop_codon:yes gene_type:complete
MSFANIINSWSTSAQRGRERAKNSANVAMQTYTTNTETQMLGENVRAQNEAFTNTINSTAESYAKYARPKDHASLTKTVESAESEFKNKLNQYGDDPLTFYRNGGRQFLEEYKDAIMGSSAVARIKNNIPSIKKYLEQQSKDPYMLSEMDRRNYAAYMKGEIDNYRFAGSYGKFDNLDNIDNWRNPDSGSGLYDSWGEMVFNSDNHGAALNNYRIDHGLSVDYMIENKYNLEGDVINWLDNNHSKLYNVRSTGAPTDAIVKRREEVQKLTASNFTDATIGILDMYPTNNPFNDTNPATQTANYNAGLLYGLEPFRLDNTLARGKKRNNRVVWNGILDGRGGEAKGGFMGVLFPGMAEDSKIKVSDLSNIWSGGSGVQVWTEKGTNIFDTSYNEGSRLDMDYGPFDGTLKYRGAVQVYAVTMPGDDRETLITLEEAEEFKDQNDPNVTIRPTIAMMFRDADHLSDTKGEESIFVEVDLRNPHVAGSFHNFMEQKNKDLTFTLKSVKEHQPNSYSWEGAGKKFTYTTDNTRDAVGTLFDDANNALMKFGQRDGGAGMNLNVEGSAHLLAFALEEAESGNPLLILQEVGNSYNKTHRDMQKDYQQMGEEYQLPPGANLDDLTEGSVELQKLLVSLEKKDYETFYNTIQSYEEKVLGVEEFESKLGTLQKGTNEYRQTQNIINSLKKQAENKVDEVKMSVDHVSKAIMYYGENVRGDLKLYSFQEQFSHRSQDKTMNYYENPGGLELDRINEDHWKQLDNSTKNFVK